MGEKDGREESSGMERREERRALKRKGRRRGEHEEEKVDRCVGR